MADYTRHCIVCNSKYEYCISCSKFDNLPTWMYMFGEENCMNIFYALSNYSCKQNTKEETIEALKKCDLSNIENFNDHIKQEIKQLLQMDEPAQKE